MVGHAAVGVRERERDRVVDRRTLVARRDRDHARFFDIGDRHRDRVVPVVDAVRGPHRDVVDPVAPAVVGILVAGPGPEAEHAGAVDVEAAAVGAQQRPLDRRALLVAGRVIGHVFGVLRARIVLGVALRPPGRAGKGRGLVDRGHGDRHVAVLLAPVIVGRADRDLVLIVVRVDIRVVGIVAVAGLLEVGPLLETQRPGGLARRRIGRLRDLEVVAVQPDHRPGHGVAVVVIHRDVVAELQIDNLRRGHIELDLREHVTLGPAEDVRTLVHVGDRDANALRRTVG